MTTWEDLDRRDAEMNLAALIAGPGVSAGRALDLARAYLDAGALLPADAERTCAAVGIPPAAAARVVAALALAVSVSRSEVSERHAMHRPAAAARYLLLRHGRRDQEVMGALYLDSRQRLIAERELFRGTINRAAVEPRPILAAALEVGAAGFLLFHTHPSGDPAPSAEDLAFTRRLADAGEVLGVRLLDHLILGTTRRWVSLRERGAW